MRVRPVRSSMRASPGSSCDPWTRRLTPCVVQQGSTGGRFGRSLSDAFLRLRCRRIICVSIRTLPILLPASTNMTADLNDSAARQHMGVCALKYNEEFLVADAMGDIAGDGDGLFLNDTRQLSRFTLEIGGVMPSLLSSGVSQGNVFFTASVTNGPLPQLGDSVTPAGFIDFERARFLSAGGTYVRRAL